GGGRRGRRRPGGQAAVVDGDRPPDSVAAAAAPAGGLGRLPARRRGERLRPGPAFLPGAAPQEEGRRRGGRLPLPRPLRALGVRTARPVEPHREGVERGPEAALLAAAALARPAGAALRALAPPLRPAAGGLRGRRGDAGRRPRRVARPARKGR